MPDYIRVTSRATGHESTIPAHRFDAKKHKKAGKDAVDRHGDPLPPKFRTTVDKEAAKKRPETTNDSSATGAEGTAASDGHQATETKETD